MLFSSASSSSRREARAASMTRARGERLQQRAVGNKRALRQNNVHTQAKNYGISMQHALLCPTRAGIRGAIQDLILANPNRVVKVGGSFTHRVHERPFSPAQCPGDVYDRSRVFVLAYGLEGKDYPEGLETAAIQEAKQLGVGVNTKDTDGLPHGGYHGGDLGVVYAVLCLPSITTVEQFRHQYKSAHTRKREREGAEMYVAPNGNLRKRHKPHKLKPPHHPSSRTNRFRNHDGSMKEGWHEHKCSTCGEVFCAKTPQGKRMRHGKCGGSCGCKPRLVFKTKANRPAVHCMPCQG